MSIPIRSMSAMRCSADVPCDPRPHTVLPVDLLAARVRLRFQKPARDRLVALDHRRGLDAGHVAMDIHGEPFAAGMRGSRKASRDSRAFRQTGEQHLGAPVHVGICSPGITSTARLSLHAAWSMFAAGNCRGNLCGSGASQVCQHLRNPLSATSQRKILNADVSRFTLMHADGDSRRKTKLMASGPCPVNHTDPTACFACICFHLR